MSCWLVPAILNFYISISINLQLPIISFFLNPGVFFRKMIVFLDKLTFSQSVKVYRLYQQYYLMGKSSLKNESFSPPAQPASSVCEDMKSMSMSIDKASVSDINPIEPTEPSGNIEISVKTQNPFTNPIVALFGVDPTP